MATAFRGDDILRGIQRIPERRVYGRVVAILGMLVEIAGLENSLSIGARCELVDRFNRRVRCEIIGFRDNRALAGRARPTIARSW